MNFCGVWAWAWWPAPPKKRKMNLKKAAGRAIQSVGEAVENISDAMDM